MNVQPTAKTSDDQVQPSTPSEEKIIEITNLFANLEAETVVEGEVGAPISSSSSGSQQTIKPQVARKPQMFIEDKLLKLYCLYNDANKIRDYLRTKWSEYASRKIDIPDGSTVLPPPRYRLLESPASGLRLCKPTTASRTRELKGIPSVNSPCSAEL